LIQENTDRSAAGTLPLDATAAQRAKTTPPAMAPTASARLRTTGPPLIPNRTLRHP
jgi:hypothetical protein